MADYLTRVAEAGSRTTAPIRPPLASPLLPPAMHLNVVAPPQGADVGEPISSYRHVEGMSESSSHKPVLQAMRTNVLPAAQVAHVAEPISSGRHDGRRSEVVNNITPSTSSEAVRQPASIQAAERPVLSTKQAEPIRKSVENVADSPPSRAAPVKPLLSPARAPETPSIPRPVSTTETTENPRTETALPIPTQEQHSAELMAKVRVPRSSPPMPASPAAPVFESVGSPATTRVRMPTGLRPHAATDERNGPQESIPAAQRIDPQPLAVSRGDTEALPAPGRSTNPMGAGIVESKFAPASVEGKGLSLAVTETVFVLPDRDADGSPRTSPPKVRVGPIPSTIPPLDDPNKERFRRERTEPVPLEFQTSRDATQVSTAHVRSDAVTARVEPRSAKLTIGRIDIDVHVQPVPHTSAPVPPPTEARSESFLDQHYVDRFGLRL